MTVQRSHTPGPWKLGLVNGVFDFHGIRVATCWGKTDEVGHFNARLTAAAPELLEVLQAAVEHIGIVQIGKGLEADSLRDKARAAIAKATGGAE